jgi:hypothetical protein
MEALCLAAIVMPLLGMTAHAGPWSPENSEKTVAWFDAQDAATVHQDDAGGRVSQWDDKSGNTNHAVQAKADDQPYYTSS